MKPHANKSALSMALVGAAFGAIVASGTSASAHTATSYFTEGKWAADDQYRVGSSGSLPHGSMETVMNNAAVSWNNVSGSWMDVQAGTHNTTGYYSNPCSAPSNDIWVWGYAFDGVGGYLADASSCINSSGYRYKSRIRFDVAENWYWGSGSPASNQYDAESVAAHELGHALGFQIHLTGSACNAPMATMCATTPIGTKDMRALQLHDIHTTAAAY